MITEGVTGNCGMVLIAQLGQTAESYGGVTTLKKSMATAKKQGYTKAIITINQHQFKYWEPNLLNLEFKLVETFINKRTKNTIKVFISDV